MVSFLHPVVFFCRLLVPSMKVICVICLIVAGALNIVTLGFAGDVTSATTGYDLYDN